MRLDKILRARGIASRKDTEAMIAAGRITVNGVPAAHKSQDCGEADVIAIDSVPIREAAPVYLLLHKPAGCVTAVRDAADQTVMDLLPDRYQGMALFPVGRLDKDSEGMLLLTNDGDFASRLMEPEQHVPKTYYIDVAKPFPPDTEARFRAGITLSNGTVCRPAEIVIAPDRRSAHVTIDQGITHQVRRMSAACGSRVVYLKRIAIGGLEMEESLEKGRCRELTGEEVEALWES